MPERYFTPGFDSLDELIRPRRDRARNERTEARAGRPRTRKVRVEPQPTKPREQDSE